MTYLFHMGLCLAMIIVQTTVMPGLPVFRHFYDLLLPFVLYLGLYRFVREGLLTVLVLGFVMDNLSGAPFGVYLTAYFWIFMIVNWGATYLHVDNRILLLIVSAAGVLIENLIFLGTMTVPGQEFQLPAGVIFDRLVNQTVWVLFTGPVLIVSFRFLHGRFEKWMEALAAAASER